ncbi:LOW QUALITY PROTEIN: AT-rich interactive domain-containing protein 3C [Spodoptera litura]|uniref:LOW QUALITY PROTEIN: AT-rich interactive domain-containing protein 3C n=1 Tax=Spodoptera litura TaxID=69820 RepID=A0A9J7ESL4_SPOLT|nr:LOW QUALITY PROTEIN: AT-rich interactive domain-containing protein 3C [Spodoptera litura]
MADADRDSDLGDDSPVNAGLTVKQRNGFAINSARSEGESSGEQSCESSDEGVGRDAPGSLPHQPHQPMQPHQGLQSHQSLQHQSMTHQPSHNISHHGSIQHQPLNSHQMSHQHQRNSPRPLERELKVRDDFESLKSSLHPHLSSLASLAQGAPLSNPGSVFALAGAGATGGFPYAPPAFLAPAPPPPAQPAGSASSSSSEGSAAGWSFEEQYKQVRQLYEISDDPQRKEFLDDLFSFMQKRGTPINRLPIMAKSVLDLYELYNLVIARGGLVEVINKKLWQEIIKGLRLPSSITSAAFTLRTQYMKYLYDYECEKKNLSTRSELDAAIEGNKREGRRASGQYDAQAALAMPPLNRVPASLAQLSQHMQPLSLSLGGVAPRLPPLPPHLGQHDIEYRVREYMKMIQQQRELMRHGSESPPNGPGPIMSPRDAAALSAIDVSRLTLWSMCNNNNNSSPLPDLEPQREALNLSESPNSVTSGGKREACRSPAPPAKRRTPRPASGRPRAPPPRADLHSPPAHRHARRDQSSVSPPQMNGGGVPTTNGVNGAAFKITTRGDASTGDHQLVVSIELNGVTYEGVLFPSGNGQNGHRQMVS